MASTIDQDVQHADARAGDEPARAGSTRSRRRPIVIAVILILVLIGLGWAFQKWRYAQSHETTENAQVDGHIIPVIAKVGGYVTAVSVLENDSVDAGDLLVQLDSSEYIARVHEAEANLTAARATAGTGSTTGQAEAQIANARSEQQALDAQIQAAQAEARSAQADLARYEELAAQQIVSRQQLDAARTAAEAARARVTSLESQAAAAGASVSSARAGMRLAEARAQGASAALENAKLQLSYTRMTAPESGVVARKNVEIGQLVQPGQPLMSIVSDSVVWVTANFKETQLADMRIGQDVELEIDAYPGCVARGTIESISSATGAKFALLPPDNATGNFTKVVQRVPVRITVDEGCGEAHPLRPGMSVNAKVETR